MVWTRRRNERWQMYSQNNEEEFILKFFKNRTAEGLAFLDIGAHDAFKFSNTRALYERGFKGTLVEPSPACYDKLMQVYGNDPGMQVLPVAISDKNETVSFWDSGGFATSSLIEETTSKWTESYGTQYTKIEVEACDIPTLLSRCRYQKYQFVNIDTEGNVFEILQQINPAAIGCELMCVEWASENLAAYEAYFQRHGMEKILQNGENLIYSRPAKEGLLGSVLSWVKGKA